MGELTTKTKGLLVSVVAESFTDDQLHPEDVKVKGTYSILLDVDVDIAEAADVAMDIFHSSVPIKILDDFYFTVLHKGEELFGADDWENYSKADRGSLVGKV